MRLHEIFSPAKDDKADDNGAVDDIINSAVPLYVPVPKPGPTGKGKKKGPPVTDRAQNSLIQTLWFYNNSDAS